MPKECQDSDLPLGGDLYARGTYSEGGTYMLVNTVCQAHVLRSCLRVAKPSYLLFSSCYPAIMDILPLSCPSSTLSYYINP